MLNRRKLFSLFPLSLLGLAVGAKAEQPAADSDQWYTRMIAGLKEANAHFAQIVPGYPPVVQEPSIWVEVVCDFREDQTGRLLTSEPLPFRPRKSKFIDDDDDGFWAANNRAGQREYEKAKAEWDAAIPCGQRFKCVTGAMVECPKCGHSKVVRMKGIPC